MLNWSVNNTMTAEWCRQVAEDAIERYGAPEIFNTDQGSQFTSAEFTSTLESHKIQISMDGKERAIDNIFAEQLWRSVKYEHVYLHIYDDAVQLYERLSEHFDFYTKPGLTRILPMKHREPLCSSLKCPHSILTNGFTRPFLGEHHTSIKRSVKDSNSIRPW